MLGTGPRRPPPCSSMVCATYHDANNEYVVVLNDSDVPLDVILKDKSAINVHKSAAEMQVYVSCGNIVGAIQR